MSDETLFLRAKEQFDDGNFSDCVSTCCEILRSDYENKSQVHLLAAKSFISMFLSPMDDENNETLYKSIGMACASAKSIEEIWQIEEEFFRTFYKWKRKNIRAQINALVAEPTLDKYKEYIQMPLGYAKMPIFVQIRTRNCEIVNNFCAEQGIEKKDYAKKYDHSCNEDDITDIEVIALKYKAAQKIFDNTVRIIDEYSHVTGEAYSAKFPSTMGAILLVGLLIDYDDENLPDDIKCDMMKYSASVLDYRLKKVCYPNGNATHYDLSDRDKGVQELQDLYAKITELDPDFVPPELPQIAAIGATNSGSASSGGCYVATAVYGSYDCPEVWTLRRFRDNTLASTWYGRAFVRTYYAISPTLVKWFGNTQWFKNMWRAPLDKMVADLNENGVESTPYNDRQW